ncbi:hypothetical protein CVT27_18920 [Streptomyces cavourensis]|nr:hypothetical protein CVT27_18920 [Streptomyces cavourensis]
MARPGVRGPGPGARGAGCGVRGPGPGVRGAGSGARGPGPGVRGAGCGVRGAGCGVGNAWVFSGVGTSHARLHLTPAHIHAARRIHPRPLRLRPRHQ